MSSTSSTASTPSPPGHTPRPLPRTIQNKNHRPEPIGVDPSQLIGKILKGVRRSRNHPNATLHFTDHSSFQILVDGYDPKHRGIPKSLEMDSGLEPIFSYPGDFPDGPRTITNAARITMADKAFDLGGRGCHWDQAHCGIAMKFKEDGHWHCVWATLAEYEDDDKMNCIFRSYHDVYLAALHHAPDQGKRKQRRRQNGSRNNKTAKTKRD